MTMPRGGSAEVANVGQVIEDGDGGRMIIRATAEQTAGAVYEFDWFIPPGRRMVPHYHPIQEEHFEGVSGTLHVMINGKRHILRPGDRLAVPPGVYHTVGNPTAEVGHAIAAFRPAMNIHPFFVEFFEALRASRGLKRQVWVSTVLRRYTEFIKFRKPMQLLIAMLARLPIASKRRTDLPPS
jgi:quercetin dioxygenase-like cupin family protein